MKREVKVFGLQYSQSQIGSYICILAEQNGSRKLPIIIKTNDAQFIALKVEGMESPRPFTHELVQSVCVEFDMDCQEVEIYKLLAGIFYARIVVSNGIESRIIDCTAGDGIALSLAFECPLYAQEEVLDQIGMEIDTDGNIIPEEQTSNSSTKKGNILSIEDMQRMLDEALLIEDYVTAAMYRDKIKEVQEGE